MKVGNLKTINKYLKDNDISLDYSHLFKFIEEDIELIVKNINEGNQNIDYVINFLEDEIRNPNWKDAYEKLEGIKEFDIKKYLIEKILTAKNKEFAHNIYYNHQLDDIDFQTLNEYKVYIDCLNTYIVTNVGRTYENLKKVLFLKEFSNEDERCILINKIYSYSTNNKLNVYQIETKFDDKTLSQHLIDIIDLLNCGYDIDKVKELYSIWNDRLIEECYDKEIVNENYRNVISYLQTSK